MSGQKSPSDKGVWSKTPPKGWPYNTPAWTPKPLDEFLRWLFWTKHKDGK